MHSSQIVELLGSHRYAVLDETHLQAAIGEILTDAACAHTREARIGPRERVDFLTASRVAIEVKIAGAPADVLRQLTRYAASGEVASLVLATTKAAHVALPIAVGGKALHVVLMRGAG